MSDIIEIEDFLPKLQQNQIKNLLLVDTHILWRQQSFCVLDKLEGKKASTNDPNIKEINQFTHYLFDNREKEPKSDYYDQIAPLLRRNVQKKFNIEIFFNIPLYFSHFFEKIQRYFWFRKTLYIFKNFIFFSLNFCKPFSKCVVERANLEKEKTINSETFSSSTSCIASFSAGLLSFAPDTP